MNLDNFPPVYYISLEESLDRQTNLKNQFEKYGIKNYTPLIFKRFSESPEIIHGKYVSTLNSSNKGASTSHLKAIKKWLTESEEPYAVFFEDDVSFETIEYWNFTWSEFLANLPSDWEAVQLMWVRPHMVKIEFRERYPDDWSATAFMLTRKYGQTLIDKFMMKNGEFNYDLGEFQPIVENVMFGSGKVYTFPLFVEETKLPTTFINSPEFDPTLIVKGQGESHHESRDHVLNWWKNIGKYRPIEKIMSTENLPLNFEWGKFSPELQRSLKKEIISEKIYEKFYTIQQGDVVVDIGASVGPFSRSIIDRKPKILYCLEPSKELFVSLVRNLSTHSHKIPTVFINKAVASKNTKDIREFSGDENVYGQTWNFDSIEFMEFINRYGIDRIDFLKMDCEGGEYSVFTDESIDWILKNVSNIAAEFHLTYPGHKEKFKNFRDNYLQRFEKYQVFSTPVQNFLPGFELNLTRWIFDDRFLESFIGELNVYVQN